MIKIISKNVDELKDLMTQKDCKKLKELIISNPDAPLLIFVGGEAWSGDVCYESVAAGDSVIKEITIYDDKKNRLLDLLIEFDEMGFAPTTVCEDSEEYAKKWRDQVWEAVKALETENAALRERLEKAVELPVKVGGKVYMPWEWDGASGVAELTVNYISLFEGEFLVDTDLKSDDIGYIGKYSFGQFRDYDFGVKVFAAHEAAEARLEELKGEKS